MGKVFIGCCGGGLERHEVCSHVKKYISEQLSAQLSRIEAKIPEDAVDLNWSDLTDLREAIEEERQRLL